MKSEESSLTPALQSYLVSVFQHDHYSRGVRALTAIRQIKSKVFGWHFSFRNLRAVRQANKIRLCDFPGVKKEILQAPAGWIFFNPSIARHGDQTYCVVRAVQESAALPSSLVEISKIGRSYNFFGRVQFGSEQRWTLLDDSAICDNDLRAISGLEDSRLFFLQGNPYLLASATRLRPTQTGTMVLAKITAGEITDAIFFESPSGRSREKNWMAASKGDSLSFCYTASPSVRLDFHHGNLSRQDFGGHQISGPFYSGSSGMVEYQSGYIAVLHRRVSLFFRHYYIHCFGYFDGEMRIRRFSREFRFEGADIEFCAGLIVDKGRLQFSAGLSDKLAAIYEVPDAFLQSLDQ